MNINENLFIQLVRVMNNSWFSTITRQGEQKIQINSTEVDQTLYLEIKQKLALDISVIEVLKWMVNRVVVAYENYQKQYQTKITKLTTGEINNLKGRWHEFIVSRLFAQVALDFYRTYAFLESKHYIYKTL